MDQVASETTAGTVSERSFAWCVPGMARKLVWLDPVS